MSANARIADPDEAISFEELGLAARNHGFPLEALRYDVTPVGLHYLLTHYDIPAVDPGSWRLRVDGHVQQPITLRLDELRELPRASHTVTFECAGNGRAKLSPRPVSQPWLEGAVGTATWTGTSLAALLRTAGIRPGAVDVAFAGADHGLERGIEQDYVRGLAVDDCLRDEVLLAYEMNGQPLPPQHGFPLRLVVPGWYGMAQVKWLTAITVLDRSFDGFQNEVAYRYVETEDGPTQPVTRIKPRALMIPPGMPDFMSRERVVDAGAVTLEGRAWSGWAPIAQVEVSIDAGETWKAAELDASGEQWAWRRWSYAWAAEPGTYQLAVRAADEAGNVQPVDQPWNRQGVGNNMVQRIPVTVRPA